MVETIDANDLGSEILAFIAENADKTQHRVFVVFKHNEGLYAAVLRGDAMNKTLGMGISVDHAITAAKGGLEARFPGFVCNSIEPFIDKRPSWESYFIGIAMQVAKRATCPRKAVGAILVRDKRILATGYNGAIPGLPHCLDIGCDLIQLADGTFNCHRIVHAEMNAILQAAYHGVSVAGSDLYVNTYPCWNCFKAIASVKVQNIFYADNYRNDPRVVDAAMHASIKLKQLSLD